MTAVSLTVTKRSSANYIQIKLAINTSNRKMQ